VWTFPINVGVDFPRLSLRVSPSM